MELNIIGRKTAWYSFLIGTSFLLAYLTFSNTDWISFWMGSDVVENWIQKFLFLFAYQFIGIAFIVNLVILLTVIVKVITDKVNRNTYLQTALFMLLNIPIAMVYFYIVLFTIFP